MVIHIEARRQSTFSEQQWTDSGGDTVRVALVGTGYAPGAGAENSDRNWSQISSNEISATGYTAGGVAITSKALEDVVASDDTFFNGGEANFGAVSAGATARWGVLLKWDGSNNGNSKILRVIDLRPLNNGNDVTTNGETIRIVPQDGHWYQKRSNA